MIRTLVVGALLTLALPTLGCDVCGIFLNVQPNDRSTQIGLLYRLRTLSRDFGTEGVTLLKHGGTVEPDGERKVKELIQAMELRADIRLADRWALLAAAPVVNTYQSVNGYQTYDVYGLGDPFALMRYQLVNTKRTLADTTARFVHRLQLGAGIKVPLGFSEATYAGERLHPDAQPGTGSWDALVSIEYALRTRGTGLMFSSLGRINTSNVHGIRMGHTLSTTLDVFHTFQLGNSLQVLPSLGGYLEWAGHENDHGMADKATGGTTWFATAGLRAYWKSWMFTATYQKALGWDIGDEMTATDQRVVTGLSFFLRNN
jgi:hypothetical protein